MKTLYTGLRFSVEFSSIRRVCHMTKKNIMSEECPSFESQSFTIQRTH